MSAGACACVNFATENLHVGSSYNSRKHGNSTPIAVYRMIEISHIKKAVMRNGNCIFINAMSIIFVTLNFDRSVFNM